MSRVDKIASWVKKDLLQFNKREISFSEIIEAINQAQQAVAMADDVLDVTATMTLTTAGTNYPLIITVLNPESVQVTITDIVKRIKSSYYNVSGIKPPQWLNNAQFDYQRTVEAAPAYPKYATVRNNTIEFYGAPGIALNGKTFTMQIILSKQSTDASGTYEPETPQQYDSALRYYADWYLLPLESTNREVVIKAFNDEITNKKSILANKDNLINIPDGDYSGRVGIIMDFVRKDLLQFNMKDISVNQLLYAINQAQQAVAMADDVLDVTATMTLTTAGTNYPLIITVLNPTSVQVTITDIVKRIKSSYYNVSGIKPPQWLNNAQFDYQRTVEAAPAYPKYATVRNNTIEFYGAPGIALNGKTFTMQIILSKQSTDASGTYEPETPQQYDSALRYYADWYLLPLESTNREVVIKAFNDEITNKKSILANKDNLINIPDGDYSGRVGIIMDFVRKDLLQFNMKDISVNQLLYAINKAQESLVMTEDLIYNKITIPIVAGTNIYPLVFGTPPQSIIKKVKSVQFPPHWSIIQWRTSQQFDNDQDTYSDLTYPQFATIRNSALEFWGIPQDIPGSNLYLACLLSRQTQDCSYSYEPETPQAYDAALRYYADWYLMPVDDPNRDKMYLYYESELKKFEGTFNNTDSYSRNPDPNW